MAKIPALGRRYEKVVEDQIATGKYADAEQVLRAALELLEQKTQQREQAIAELKGLIEEGLASGDAGPLDLDAIYEEAIGKTRAA